ncbi:MAG: peroxidase family protein [Isosphaeraceae bacterium]
MSTANALRTFRGGMLKTSAGGLLPINDAATFPGGPLPMANDAHIVPDDQLFAAGDVRADENIELTSLQTLFVREHNAWAARISAGDPSLNDEPIYQRARAIVIGEIQAITYNQWLPTLLGPGAIAPYRGYNPAVNPGISNEFSTAAFRFGHSMLGDDVEFLDNQGLEVRDSIPLSQAFSNPGVVKQAGIDPLLKYLASDPASEVDVKVVDSVRNMLFGPPGSGGLDLASLNIQRGRDHGLADYNTVRQALGLPRVTGFDQITSDGTLAAKLRSLYGSVDNVDLWVGALAEDHVPGGSVGPTTRAILADQFTRLRDGDRFWYQNAFSGPMLRQIDGTNLSDVIRRDTGVANLQDNPFVFRAGISGVVFVDGNRNGRQDRGEPGLPAKSVQLVDVASGLVVATAKTDAQGVYRFRVADGLRTGRYRVGVAVPRGPALLSPTLAITRGDQFADGVNFGMAPPGGAARKGALVVTGSATPAGPAGRSLARPRGRRSQ